MGRLTAADLVRLAAALAPEDSQPLALLTGTGWRYNLLALEPVLCLEVRQDCAVLRHQDQTLELGNTADALAYLYREEAPVSVEFAGGWIGALTYEALHQLEGIRLPEIDLLKAPALSFLFADSYICQDPHTGQAELLLLASDFSQRSGEERARHWLDFHQQVCSVKSAEHTPLQLFSHLLPLLSRERYLEMVCRIREYICAGDVYQVNLTYPVAAIANEGVTGEQILRQLLSISGGRWSAWLRESAREIVSLSPESFLERRQERLWTRPIKGTSERMSDRRQDEQSKQLLQQSVKDLAELSMIVDLERNDLGRICRPGSVTVKGHASLLELPALYHLYTEVSGLLARPAAAILPALFPGGSITGAPKIRAMQIISELEEQHRGVYTGAIGWIGLDGECEFNVAIRTLQRLEERWYLSTGGGIVHDSDPAEEYLETLHKLYSFSGIRPEEIY